MEHRQTTSLQDDGRVAALVALDDDQVKRLAAYATLRSRGLQEEGRDLLQSAYQRWLGSDVPVVGPAETASFLFGAINSIRSNEFRRKTTQTAAFGHRLEADPDDEEAEAPVELVPATAATAEDTLYAQQVYDALDDPELQMLILLLAERTPREKIKSELGWDDNKYDAMQKRKLRAVAKLLREGKI